MLKYVCLVKYGIPVDAEAKVFIFERKEKCKEEAIINLPQADFW